MEVFPLELRVVDLGSPTNVADEEAVETANDMARKIFQAIKKSSYFEPLEIKNASWQVSSHAGEDTLRAQTPEDPTTKADWWKGESDSDDTFTIPKYRFIPAKITVTYKTLFDQ